jgi:hypothetical protein
MKTNKYTYLYVLQGDYGFGFEDLACEDKTEAGAIKRIKQTKKEYLDNDKTARGFRIIERRELK